MKQWQLLDKKRLTNYDSRMANNTIKYFVFAQFYIF